MPTHVSRRLALRAIAGSLALATLGACATGGDATSDTAAGTAAAATPATTGGAPGDLAYGLQLYTVREAAAKNLDSTLAALAAAGYRNMELAGTYGQSAQQFRQTLDRHGLRAASMHVPVQALRADAAAVMRDAEVLGVDWIVVPWLDQGERTAAGYRKVGEEMKQWATMVPAGKRLGYHNHDFEFQQVDGGRTGLDVLMEAAGPDVGMELDLYWAVKAGQDPLAVAAKYPGRVALVHVKDAGPAPDRRMMDVGAGTIDFATILGRLKAQGLKYGFVEHDQPADPIATARAGIAHLDTLTLRP